MRDVGSVLSEKSEETAEAYQIHEFAIRAFHSNCQLFVLTEKEKKSQLASNSVEVGLEVSSPWL